MQRRMSRTAFDQGAVSHQFANVSRALLLHVVHDHTLHKLPAGSADVTARRRSQGSGCLAVAAVSSTDAALPALISPPLLLSAALRVRVVLLSARMAPLSLATVDPVSATFWPSMPWLVPNVPVLITLNAVSEALPA